jgi:hypothetical protein
VGLGPATAAATGLSALLAAWLTFNTRPGRALQERAVEGITRYWRGLIFDVIPGLFHLIMSAYNRLIEWVEKLIYAVDEWLRFREGQSAFVLAFKAVLGVFWGVIAYAARIYLVLLIEPQINPIKHFPVVTVAAKIMLPFVLVLTSLIAAPLKPLLGAVIANAIAATTVFFLPGVFGFLVWELRSNWRLYDANRPANLGPIAVGSHGETVVRFLRPAFHSGTVPKRFAKLRRALRASRPRTALKHREALHHVEEATRRLIEREFAGLLAESRSFAGRPIEPGSIHLATARIRVELLGEDRDRDSLWIDLEERLGELTARVWRPGWLEGLDDAGRRALADALAGLYKISGVEWVEAADPGLDGSPPMPVDFATVMIPWPAWVREWEREDGRTPDAKGPAWRADVLPDSSVGVQRV